MKDKLPPICERWREEAQRRNGRDLERPTKGADGGGVLFQVPSGWDDGSGKIRHVQSGPLKGRVCFSSQREAREIAKRIEAKEGSRVRYNPD